MAGLFRLWALALGLSFSCVAAAAQDSVQPGVVQSQILTVEIDRLFAESAYGQRITRMLEAEGSEIAAENRRIEAELTAEEKDLTEKRATLSPSEFRALAEAFDQKVQELRREQDTKARSLGNLSEERRRQFLAAAEPVLAQLMREAGAAVILDKRTVFLSAGVIDITDTAIARIDAAIGDGAPQGETGGTATEEAPAAQE
ncbi:OmpH family outer membrane protein [Salipiger abyssi]|uniref:Outer membrane protein n=1 Tax=Salipiger abyssi TaxID=1250539 RepID=A0A1P8UZ23_9RHOB|nr:OmpH family outer membrane protein [Salipiger abyssi]APZ54645.1 outer membrane protein [Salipiger abyssi]